MQHLQKRRRIMSLTETLVEGTLKPDGTLELDRKLSLPAGRVQVIVVPLPELPKDDPFWQRMQAIWEGQKARGHIPRSVEEVEAERRAVREEWEERMGDIERIQERGRTTRTPGEQAE